MEKLFVLPELNSEEGRHFYDSLAESIGHAADLHEIAILTVVRLLVYLPVPICHAIISPLAEMALLINHEDPNVKLIVKARLKCGI